MSVNVPEWAAVSARIVDNGSTDATRETVTGFAGGVISVLYLAEPRRGKCHAMNRALAAIPEGIVLLTDDDVRLPKNWIESLCCPILSGQADAVAGPVRFPPAIEAHLQAKGLSALQHWFAHTGTSSLKANHPFVGANAGFSTRVLSRVPAWDPELGPGALGFFDETLFCWQVLDAGFRISVAVDATVEHHLDVSRLGKSNLIKLARQKGASHAYVEHHWMHRNPSFVPFRLLKACVRLGFLKLIEFARPFPSRARLDTERHLARLRHHFGLRGTPAKYARSTRSQMVPE
jgi:glucosyl-dolichyl phosphate glucuronosyltransferase